jgi:hypothetical protein
VSKFKRLDSKTFSNWHCLCYTTGNSLQQREGVF